MPVPRPERDAPELLAAAFGRDVDLAAGRGGPREPGRRVFLRFALRAGLVLALLAAADAVLRAAYPPESLLPFMDREFAAYTVKVERFAAQPAPDLLLLGNSRVHDGLVPAVFAEALGARWGRPVRAYNLGLMNAKPAEFAALVRGHLPDPPPRRVILGVSGTELVNDDEFQYASRFLWDAAECADYLGRTPAAKIRARHVENAVEAGLASLCYAFAQRDALRAALVERLDDARGASPARPQRRTRILVARHNLAEVLSEDGFREADEVNLRLTDLLAADPDAVRIPPYSLGDPGELVAGADFPLMRRVLLDLQAKGCLVALVEMPPSPWLQQKFPEFHGPLFRRRLAELSVSLGVPCVVMPPAETFLTDAAYIDANHLGRAGAQRFSRLLLERLLAAGFFDEAE